MQSQYKFMISGLDLQFQDFNITGIGIPGLFSYLQFRVAGFKNNRDPGIAFPSINFHVVGAERNVESRWTVLL